MPVKQKKPVTHIVDVDRAMETLDFVKMVALSEMFERWALTEEKAAPEQRTKLVQWSADYELIAAYAGFSWQASNPESPPDLIAFIARREVQLQRRELAAAQSGGR